MSCMFDWACNHSIHCTCILWWIMGRVTAPFCSCHQPLTHMTPLGPSMKCSTVQLDIHSFSTSFPSCRIRLSACQGMADATNSWKVRSTLRSAPRRIQKHSAFRFSSVLCRILGCVTMFRFSRAPDSPQPERCTHLPSGFPSLRTET